MDLRKLKHFSVLIALLFLFSHLLYAQTKTITGRVTDAAGLGLPRATVTVKGTKVATVTDAEGRYTISVPANANSIVISSVGYGQQEMSVGVQEKINVTLQATASNLNEVVVIGYGTQRRRDVTGAITKVGSEKITSIPAPSFEAALQGKAAGVQVTQGSGLAGSGSVVRVRGIASISAGGDPLYVVDGIPIIQDNFLRSNSGGMNQNPLAAINPNDIESIEILKDAGATGIYGSRGANGVILITTKRGKSGKPSFNYNNKIGFATYTSKPKFLSGAEWLQARQEAWINDGNTGYAPLPSGITWADAQNTNTDWWNLVTQTGFINEHALSMNMGGKKLKTYAGLNYGNNESYIKGNAYARFSARLNMDYQFLPNLKASLTAGWNRGDNKRVPAAWAGGVGDALSYALPIYPVYKKDGSYWTGGANPVRRLNETKWRNIDNRYLAGLTFEYMPIKDLILRAAGSLDYLNSTDMQFESQNWLNRTDIPGIAKANPIWGTNKVFTGTAQYNYSLNEGHKFNFLGGVEVQENVINEYNGEIYANTDKPFWEQMNLYHDSIDHFKTHPASRPNFAERERDHWTFNSFFGRINYNLFNKFFFQLQARYDGSSKFGPNYKHGFFPSGSAAWILSEEDFIKDLQFINFLKLRGSYGIVGNANIPSGSYYYRYNVGGSPYNGNPTLYPENIGNPNLRWEELRNFDFGLEFALSKSRLTGELSYYNKTTVDQLINAGIMPSSGYADAYRNLDGGKIINNGIELSLNAKIVDKPDWKWSVGGNISKNYNEVKSLGALSADAIGGGTNDTRIIVGYPVGTNYVARFYGVDPDDGLPIWLDKDGKLTKTFSLDHRVAVGSVIPDYLGGLNSSVSYKGVELSTLFTYVIGGNIYDGAAKRQAGVVTDWNIRRDNLDHWRAPGDGAKYPRLTMTTSMYDGLSSEWQYNSTLFLYDASFLRMRELTLSYSLHKDAINKLKIKGARVFVTGMNLLTFTKYPGGDPEIARDFENAQDRNMSPNVSYLTPPQQKSVVFGVNVTF
ncbi:TonB-dependent receptor [Chitinophagaceae bacterium LB-8]|uniref:TonB-dependent receptor n=1 Tax=Paraflavisolibacter caeni TaxID=2982496 RepID=A0A9X3BHM8_9BACT|nr:TonB-dependent receptor [Paraflavisolibacter caeni]MCU7552594.1 TonB-dependent receptor [Paraflavisolibacter caeni]